MKAKKEVTPRKVRITFTAIILPAEYGERLSQRWLKPAIVDAVLSGFKTMYCIENVRAVQIEELGTRPEERP